MYYTVKESDLREAVCRLPSGDRSTGHEAETTMTLGEWYEGFDANAVRRFVTEQRQEDLSLDFKRALIRRLEGLPQKRYQASPKQWVASSCGGGRPEEQAEYRLRHWLN